MSAVATVLFFVTSRKRGSWTVLISSEGVCCTIATTTVTRRLHISPVPSSSSSSSPFTFSFVTVHYRLCDNDSHHEKESDRKMTMTAKVSLTGWGSVSSMLSFEILALAKDFADKAWNHRSCRRCLHLDKNATEQWEHQSTVETVLIFSWRSRRKMKS